MRNLTRVGGIAAMSLVLVVALFAGGALAAPQVDTESSDTSTTSDWTDNANNTSVDASASNYTWIEANFTVGDKPGNNTKIEIIDPDTGVVHASNDSDGMKNTNVDQDYYAWNLSHDELATVPHDGGENKSLTVKFINGTDLDSPETTEITIYLEYVDDRAVVYMGDETAADNVDGQDVETETDSGLLGFGASEAETTAEADNVGLGNNASGTTVNVVVANTSGEDPFGDADSKSFSRSYSDAEFMSSHAVLVEGHNHAVFKNEAPDDSELADEITFAYTDEIGGHDAYRIEVADDYEDEDSVDVTASANDGYNFLTAFRVEQRTTGGALASIVG